MSRLPLALALLPLLLVVAPVQAQGSDGATIGVSKVWTGAADNIEERLDVAEALGAGVLQVSTTFNGFKGAPRQIELATTIADAASARGIRVLLAVGGRQNVVNELTPVEVRAGGVAWGRWAASRMRDVAGFSVLNEVNLAAQRLNRNQGPAAAEAIIQHEAALTVAFAEGVRSECPRCKVIPGGLGGRELNQDFEFGVRFMEVLAPHARSGLLAGLDTHWYRTRRAFRFGRDASGTLRARWEENPQAILDDLLSRGGWPRDTDLYMTEVNVRRSTFRNPDEAGAALAALLSALKADPRTRVILVFNPYHSEEGNQNYGIDVGSPVGEAVREVATRSGPNAGYPGGSAGAESPWYCRLLGIGCR